jgi:hypothetical protein
VKNESTADAKLSRDPVDGLGVASVLLSEFIFSFANSIMIKFVTNEGYKLEKGDNQ